MSVALDTPAARVGAEFRGLARQFRDRVRAADARFERALSSVIAPLRARLQRHTRLRLEQSAVAVSCYRRTVPAEFRLGEVTTHPDRDAFRVAETRVTATWAHSATWADQEREPGIAVAGFSLRLDQGRLMLRWLPLALISLHALARRIERGADRSHDALTADLTALAAADAEGDRVSAGAGFWIGDVVGVQSKGGVTMARAVRTWHC